MISYARLLRFVIALSIIIGINTMTSAGNRGGQLRGENIMTGKTIKEVLEEHSGDLMSIDGVVGTGQGLCQGKPCIMVFVVKKTPEIKEKIPKILQGYPVMIEETGRVRALPENRN
jgi:hypothetical protein